RRVGTTRQQFQTKNERIIAVSVGALSLAQSRLSSQNRNFAIYCCSGREANALSPRRLLKNSLSSPSTSLRYAQGERNWLTFLASPFVLSPSTSSGQATPEGRSRSTRGFFSTLLDTSLGP